MALKIMDVQSNGLVVLPPKAAELCCRWNFEPIEELPGGHCSQVFASKDRVLKVPFQGEEAISGWKMALMLSGNLGPTVFEHDPETGSLLMERVVSGTKLSELGESEDRCRSLFKRCRDRIAGLPSNGLMRLYDYFSRSTPLVQELLATTTKEVALHGDLHHENILLGDDGWVVIDPKGLVGDPAFEAAAFMHNPVEELLSCSNLDSPFESRIKWFSEQFECDPWRIWGWSVSILDEPMPPDDPWIPIRDAMIRVEPRN